MAVNKKQPTTSTFVETPKFTGITTFTVLDVMPTNKSLKDNGFYVKENAEEPVYLLKNDNNKTKIKFDIIGLAVANVSGKEVSMNTKLTLWLEDELVVSKEGKPMFINQLWKTQYGADVATIVKDNEEAMQNYLGKNPDKKSASFMALGNKLRQAFVGEKQLMELIGKVNGYQDTITVKGANGEEEVENILSLDNKPFSKEWLKEIKEALIGNSVQLVIGKTSSNDKDYFQPVVLRFQDSFLKVGQKMSNYFISQFKKGLEGNDKVQVQHPNLNAMVFTHNTFTPTVQKTVEDGSDTTMEQDTDLPF
jgi:hypothetical protein